MNPSVEVSIVIVNWNAREYLERCLRSIGETAAAVPHEVIVVDNASADGSAEAVRRGFPHAKLIENAENRGFASANNQGLDLASGEFVFLLNPDTELQPESLQALLAFLRREPAAAVAAPKLLNTDGTLQRSVRRFPNFRTAFYRYTFLKKIGVLARAEAWNKMDDFGFDRTAPVEQPAGAALLIRRGVLEAVGRLDPNFFLFYEEVDLCRRIRQRGHEIYFCPEAQVTHHEGKSRQKNRRNLFLPTLKSLFYYFRKHRGERATRLFKLAFKPLFVVSTLWDVVEEGVSARLYAARRDEYRAGRKKEKAQLKADFLRRDLAEFLFKT